MGFASVVSVMPPARKEALRSATNVSDQNVTTVSCSLVCYNVNYNVDEVPSLLWTGSRFRAHGDTSSDYHKTSYDHHKFVIRCYRFAIFDVQSQCVTHIPVASNGNNNVADRDRHEASNNAALSDSASDFFVANVSTGSLESTEAESAHV